MKGILLKIILTTIAFVVIGFIYEVLNSAMKGSDDFKAFIPFIILAILAAVIRGIWKYNPKSKEMHLNKDD